MDLCLGPLGLTYPLAQVLVPSNLQYSGGEITPAMVSFYAEKHWHSQPEEVSWGPNCSGEDYKILGTLSRVKT